MQTIGNILYNGYCTHTNWKSLATGQDLPKWEGLRPDIQQAWEFAGAYLGHHIDVMAERTEPNYVEVAKRLKDPNTIRLLHAGMGLVTEAGEYMDCLKKFIFYGKPLDKVNLREELGDVSWYARIAASALGDTFIGIIFTNIKKLLARFPEKFTEHQANVRDLNTERKILEE